MECPDCGRYYCAGCYDWHLETGRCSPTPELLAMRRRNVPWPAYVERWRR